MNYFCGFIIITSFLIEPLVCALIAIGGGIIYQVNRGLSIIYVTIVCILCSPFSYTCYGTAMAVILLCMMYDDPPYCRR